jgi:CBS domain-containing protein
MPTVRDVLALKGESLITINSGATVLEATRKMNQYKVGAVVVMDGERVAGIVTEELQPASVIVDTVMTRDVICCDPSDDLDEVSAIMKTHRIRHVPVCDDDRALHGIISIGDINAHHATNAEQHIHFLNEYLYGRV